MQVTRRRLDAELTRRGLARSREQARELIAAGAVHVRGVAATKPATQVETSAPITVDTGEPGYVSRGALKLIGALDAFETAPLTVAGRRILDAGASTGGFTQVLLERGAERVLGRMLPGDVAHDAGFPESDEPLPYEPR